MRPVSISCPLCPNRHIIGTVQHSLCGLLRCWRFTNPFERKQLLRDLACTLIGTFHSIRSDLPPVVLYVAAIIASSSGARRYGFQLPSRTGANAFQHTWCRRVHLTLSSVPVGTQSRFKAGVLSASEPYPSVPEELRTH